MNKRFLFSAFFVIIACGICVLVANEYLKHVEIKAIENYLLTLNNEFSEHESSTDVGNISCKGIIKHRCDIPRARIINQNNWILLENITISVSHLSHKQIGVEVAIKKITHNFMDINSVFIPKNAVYILNLIKEDSKLGYVALNREVKLDFNRFDFSANSSILIRDKLFRDKNVVFLLNDWFNTTTPSFYEYSVDKLILQANNKNINDFYTSHFARFNATSLDFVRNLKNDNKSIDNIYGFESAFASFLDGKFKELRIDVSRKNDNLIFFSLLPKDAALKKMLEVKHILDSINESYKVEIKH